MTIIVPEKINFKHPRGIHPSLTLVALFIYVDIDL